MVSQPWELTGFLARRRLVGLLIGLAKQQITIHPRGVYSYQADLVNATEIMQLYHIAGCRLYEVLPLAKITDDQRAGIVIVWIVGGTALRSSAWLQGAVVLSPDLCDCVFVFIEIAGGVFAVPGVGSLAGRYRGSGFELRAAGDIKQRITTLVGVLNPGRGRGPGPALAGGARDGDQRGKDGHLDPEGAAD